MTFDNEKEMDEIISRKSKTEFIQLELGNDVSTLTKELEANFLASWLILACWYSNWTEETNSMIVSGHRSIHCPNIKSQDLIHSVLKYCNTCLNDLMNNNSVSPRATWQVQAWSQSAQCPGLFGSAHICMQFEKTSVVLQFSKQFLNKKLAYEILDILYKLTLCLKNHSDLTVQEFISIINPIHSNSELVGNLYGITNADIMKSFEENAQIAPNKLAVYDAGKSITYGDLLCQVKNLANQLRSEGVIAGSRIALKMSRSSGFIVAALAVLSLEAIYIPIDPELPVERSKIMLEDAGVGWIILSKNEAFNIQSIKKDFYQGQSNFTLKSNCGYILFTSGSSGQPKGVLVSRSALSYYTRVATHSYELTSQDRVLQFATISFDASVEEIYPCLSVGGTLVIRDETVDLRPAKFMEFVREHNITLLDLPTGYWRELIMACVSGNLTIPACVRLIIIGGEALYQSDIDNWHSISGLRPKLINSYGPTETTVVTTLQVVRPSKRDICQKNTIYIGQPIPGSRIILLDRFDNPCPLGGLGQICISSPGVAEGYLHSQELTDDKFFIRAESDGSYHRYYKSGDLGRIDLNDTIEYHGRIDDTVKRQGFRINLGEIESIIRATPEVLDCCLLMLDADKHSKLICFIQVKSDKFITMTELRHLLSSKLPTYMLPNNFIPVNELPRTLSGKINKDAIRTLIPDIANTVANDSTNKTLEDELAVGIRAILNARELDWNIGLIDNGADSLEIVRLAIFLEKHTGREWPPFVLYNYNSLQRILNDAQSSIITENNLPSFPEWGNTELNRLQNLLKINPLVNNHIKSNGILVSGATGLLGRYIVQELLCTTERPIYCLLRSPSSSDQHARLQVLLKELGMPEGKMQRLHVIKGDLTSDNLGLGIDSLIFLRGNISDIVHCAADTNMLSPYEKLANTNVLGTLKLINLALENNTRFHFISSLALFDTKDFLTRITPKSKVIEIDNLDSGYLQSKWIIEALLDKIATSNLNVIVYRCGRLWGQTKNRQEASNDFIYQFLNLCLRIKKFPDVPMQLEISSADGIARKIVHMITTPGVQYAPTYHLCSNKSYTTNEVYTSMKMRSDDLTRVDSDTWMETLKAHMQKSPDDTQAVKIYAVVKSLSLPGAIDNLAIDEHIISPEFLDDSAQSHITLDAMIDAVMEQ